MRARDGKRRYGGLVCALAMGIFGCQEPTSLREFPTRTSTVPLPEVYVLNIANPFPTLYIFNRERRLVVQGKGKDSSAFRLDLKMLDDRPLPSSESVRSIEAYFKPYIDRAHRLAPHAEFFVFFFDIDPASFGQPCAPCVDVKKRLQEHVQASERPLYVEIVSATDN